MTLIRIKNGKDIVIDGTTTIKSYDNNDKYYLKIYIKSLTSKGIPLGGSLTSKGFPLGGMGQCIKTYSESYSNLYDRNKRLKEIINIIYNETM